MTRPAIALEPAAFTEDERAARRRLLSGAILAAALLGAAAGLFAGRVGL